jgi:phenylpropionate dioxygenase-like ring-hydroxylating dioxygenase large terminal subunit
VNVDRFSLASTTDFEGIRRPLPEATTLPPWCYTSPEFFALEMERIFSRAWVFLGHVDRIPAAGSYFTTTVADAPVLVVRGDDGKVRAFHNICRHRGTIVAGGEGTARAFACPYHSWTYDTKGGLTAAPHMDAAKGFALSENGLRPVRLETWAGFLFINLDPAAPELSTYLGDLPEVLAPYRLDEMSCVRRRDYDVRCNWKVYVENAKDSEHVASVHRNSINRTSPASRIRRVVLPSGGEYVNTFMRNGGSAALLTGKTGFPKIPSLTGELAEGTTAPLIFPATYLGCTVDCSWYLNIIPLAADRIRLETGGLFPRAVTERPDFAEIMPRYVERWDTTAEEDNRVCELQQQGLSSRFATPGRLSVREELIHTIDNWVIDRLFGAQQASKEVQ